jgi:hypothetical protein
MAQELTIAVDGIDLEDAEVTNICSYLVSTCLHNPHGIILFTLIESSLV